MRTLIFLPYFGEFNNYFEIWLNSCSKNANFEWLILTDNTVDFQLPTNVRIIRFTLKELKERFQSKFDIPIVLEDAYKLCDYKQFYGYLFSDYLKEYDYWGYCDCDLIFGNIRNFLTEDIQRDYDKIMRTGHFSIVRNNVNINELFFKYGTYKITLSSPVIYGYDESIKGYHFGFAGELIDNGYKFGDFPNWIADIDFRHYPFYEITNTRRPCVFLYKNGKIFRVDRINNEIFLNERMYVHLQKRKMVVEEEIDPNCYLICPNSFCNYSDELINNDDFWENAYNDLDTYFDYRLESKQNFVRDIKRFLHEPHKINSILYRMKGH